MGGCTTQTTLIDVVHGDMCTWRSSRPSPLRRAGYTNDAAVTESSSAQAAIVRCLYDVHQQSICRPKDPGNGDSTTIGFNWRCKGLAAYCNRAKKWPKNVFTGLCLEDSRRPRWRAQLPGGSNWDLGRPGGARGDHPVTRLGPRARCRGAHETGSPELQGSIATP